MARPKKTDADSEKPRQRKANGYKFPEKLPVGEVLKDVYKKEWILGPSIGQGGFGEIYCASKYDGKVDKSYPYVIKIEPHENGPLFMEKNFYIKILKPDDIEAFKKDEKIKTLGLPTFHGSGSHTFKNEKYRFLVMERFGKDLWSIFLKNKSFPPETVYRCALQIIDVLQFIHSKEYIHGDIKGANLLLGLKKGTENNVFLVDFGLACRYSTKEFKRDPKQAHNGTIEYTSCDWHLGVPTRRGDMEILGYNLLHWLTSSLPWEKDIKNKEKVHEKKQAMMKDVNGYFKKNLPNVPAVIPKFMDYVSKLKHDESPNYTSCKNLFIAELKKLSAPTTGKLNFEAVSSQNGKTPVKKTPNKRVSTKRKTPDRKDDDDSQCSDSEEVSSKRSKKTENTPKKRNAKLHVVSDEDEDVFTPSSKTPKTTPRQRLARGAKTSLVNGQKGNTPINNITPHDNNDDSDDEIIENTPETPVKKKPVTLVKTSTKKDTTNKISWRDAPTVAGNINNKAGEYVKKAASKIPKTRKAK